MRINGKSAVVTGGASGLGAACVHMLQTQGAKVTVIDWKESAWELASVDFRKADVSSGDGVAEIVQGLGPIHILVNAAGIGVSQRVISKEGPAPLDVFERVIRVNLIGTFNCIRLCAAVMASNAVDEDGERGVIINTASIAAYDGQIGQSAYSASKGGIVGMTLPLARDLSRLGIRVMTIAPGIFDTPLLGTLPAEVRAQLGASVPHPARLGRPDEYAALAQHIIENAMLNGEVIRLDGALRMPPK